MPYIGKQPLTGAYQLCDAITTSATATYNLTVGSSPVIPGSAQNCIVSLNGVIQAPVNAYTVSGSTIVFASALTSSDVIDFIVILGNVFDIGKPTDGSVTNASVASNAAIALSKLATTGTMTFASTIGVGGATPSASGAGITFPATASASTSANTLDDYEEGTVTATMTPGTSGTLPLNASIRTLAYTKVGNVVTITGLLRLATPSSPNGTYFTIDNLPFTISTSIATYGARGGGGIFYYDDSAGTRSVLPFNFAENNTSVSVFVTASTLAANDDFAISFSYFTN